MPIPIDQEIRFARDVAYVHEGSGSAAMRRVSMVAYFIGETMRSGSGRVDRAAGKHVLIYGLTSLDIPEGYVDQCKARGFNKVLFVRLTEQRELDRQATTRRWKRKLRSKLKSKVVVLGR